jgi:molecular chaperone GrpE
VNDDNAPTDPPEEDIVFLEDESGKDVVARALQDAERAVEAVEERHRRSGEHPLPGRHEKASDPRLTDLVLQLEEERERSLKAEEEAGRLREALLRKTADFDNMKRRTEREKTDFFKFALAEVLRDLLGVVDNLERALAHAAQGAGEGEEFRVGVAMIEKQLLETLRKYGLTEVPAQGLPFDPNVHEAIVRVETDAAPPGTVVEVLQKGYALNERLLRPARVKVAAPAAEGV